MGKIAKITFGVIAGLVVIGMMADGGETDTTATNVESAAAASTVEKAQSVKAPATKAPATKAPAQSVKQKPKPARVAKTVAVEAAEILKEFEGNEAAADLRYEGKTLKVTGNVYKVDTEFWDEEQYVVQLDTGSQWDIWTVNCNDMTANDVANLSKGSTATVVGQFDDGGDLGVELNDCTLVK